MITEKELLEYLSGLFDVPDVHGCHAFIDNEDSDIALFAGDSTYNFALSSEDVKALLQSRGVDGSIACVTLGAGVNPNSPVEISMVYHMKHLPEIKRE